MQAPWKWKACYDAALLEIEIQDGRQRQRLEAAKHAIADRLEDSLHGRQPLSSAERAQIEEACRMLLFLRERPRAV